jgi:thymidylate synthase (FAD)
MARETKIEVQVAMQPVKPEGITLRSDIVVDHIGGYGGDWLIVDAARVSTKHGEGVGPRPISEARDIGLIKALIRQRHKAPFQHGAITMYVEAPIFVFREWRTHRIAMVQTTDDFAYSEASARYRPLKPEFYIPDFKTRPVMEQEGTSKMRPEYGLATASEAVQLALVMSEAYRHSWNAYKAMLESGVAPEIARAVMPVGVYSAMYVTANPLSLMHFLSLRTHEPEAAFVSYPQWEIEAAARAAEAVFEAGWPIAYQAWQESGRIS